MLALRHTLLLLLLAASGCTAAAGGATPLAGPIPAPPPGTAQIILYRTAGYYEPSDVLAVALNHQPAGTLPRGDVLYRDVAPGTYTISFSPTRPDPNQFPTLTLGPGQVAYLKLAALPVRPCNWFGPGVGQCDINGYAAMVMSPAMAQSELRGLTLIVTRGAPAG